MSAVPPPEQLVVRKDPETGLGVVYVGKELIGYRVVLVPVELIEHKWVKEARGEK